jgi:predicted tellurium resistance membrane protein TerC
VFEFLFSASFWASFLTLSALEIVLGIDNVIFIALVATRLPKKKQLPARAIGLAGAFVMRIAFLASIVWLTKATRPLFLVEDFAVSTRDIVLSLGGAFLLYKATIEIHAMTEGQEAGEARPRPASFWGAIVQIMLLDLVFSIDSVLTAVGMTSNLPVMIAAIMVAIVVMLVAAGALGRFIEEHPTTKMLALAFLLLVGVALIADAAHFHIPREYLYFAIAFSALVESLNVTVLRRHVRRPREQEDESREP